MKSSQNKIQINKDMNGRRSRYLSNMVTLVSVHLAIVFSFEAQKLKNTTPNQSLRIT
jgi:hypothetical protein